MLTVASRYAIDVSVSARWWEAQTGMWPSAFSLLNGPMGQSWKKEVPGFKRQSPFLKEYRFHRYPLHFFEKLKPRGFVNVGKTFPGYIVDDDGSSWFFLSEPPPADGVLWAPHMWINARNVVNLKEVGFFYEPGSPGQRTLVHTKIFGGELEWDFAMTYVMQAWAESVEFDRQDQIHTFVFHCTCPDPDDLSRYDAEIYHGTEHTDFYNSYFWFKEASYAEIVARSEELAWTIIGKNDRVTVNFMAAPQFNLESVQLSKRLEQFTNSIPALVSGDLPDHRRDIPPEMYADALEKSRPSTSNWLETIAGSLALPSSFKRILTALPRGPSGTIKYIASNWLFWKYAITPIPSDIKNAKRFLHVLPELEQYLENAIASNRAYSRGQWRGTMWVYVKTRGLNRDEPDLIKDIEDILDSGKPLRAGALLGKNLRELNAKLNALSDIGIPTTLSGMLRLLWECLPLSFVVDWFLNISGIFRFFEKKAYYDRLPVLYNRRTIAAFRDITPEVLRLAEDIGLADCEISVSADVNYFVRHYDRTIPDVNFAWSMDPASATEHWLELGAIVVQRVLK